MVDLAKKRKQRSTMDNLKQFLVKSVSDYVILDVDKALFNTIPSSQKADLEKVSNQ